MEKSSYDLFFYTQKYSHEWIYVLAFMDEWFVKWHGCRKVQYTYRRWK